MSHLKLFMILLGSKAPGRHTEQHDFFLGIGTSLSDLLPLMNSFWPEAIGRIHIDAWREVTAVDGYWVSVLPKQSGSPAEEGTKPALFFINLGGYLEGRFEEQHYVLLTVKPDKATALREAKDTMFYRENHFGKAVSHIDDQYGIDVDDLYQIEEMLSPEQKEKYSIGLTPETDLPEDELHLGYVKFSSL